MDQIIDYQLGGSLYLDGSNSSMSFSPRRMTDKQFFANKEVNVVIRMQFQLLEYGKLLSIRVGNDIVLTVKCNWQSLWINEIKQTTGMRMMKCHKLSLLITPQNVTILLDGKQQQQEMKNDVFRIGWEKTYISMQFVGSMDSLQIRNGTAQWMDEELKFHRRNNINSHVMEYEQVKSYPLRTLEELVDWTGEYEEGIRSIQRLRDVQRNKKKGQVIICHDMANGYKEDHCSLNNNGIHGYRFHYWLHCDIFIYFSHHLLTIPPQSYINVCHQYGVRCLGTLITEGEQGEQLNKELMNNYVVYADKLVNIQQHYGFDGYLINIESRVDDGGDKVVMMMQYLRSKGVLVIYYDSLLSNGELKWQSQLNQENAKYYEASDLMFTDYHWDLSKLQQSITNAGDHHNQKLFTGIDIWGRGSYGGSTSVALAAIKQYNGSVALFAPAWTYEYSATTHKQQFWQNDYSFWHGTQTLQLFNRDVNHWTIEANGGQGWQIVNHVAIASFEWCIRSFTVCVTDQSWLNGQVLFNYSVKGTDPKPNDPYLVAIELLNKQYQIISSINSYNHQIIISQQPINLNQTNTATSNWQHHSLSIPLHSDAKYIKFTQFAKDAEYWAGNFGAQFTNEAMQLLLKQPHKNLLKLLPARRISELPIQTYFNDAIAPHCYIDGTKYLGTYNVLNDFDLVYPQSDHVQLHDQEAWNGSTCLRITGNANATIKLFKTQFTPQGTLYLSLNIKHLTKSAPPSLLLNQVEYKHNKIALNNSWESVQFQIPTLNQQIIRSIRLKINANNTDFLLGGFGVYDDAIQDTIKSNVDFKDPTKYVKKLQVVESLNNINAQSETLVDLYILFDFGPVLTNMLKTVRIFNGKQWLCNCRGNYCYIPSISFGTELNIHLQIVVNNGHHMKAESTLPIIIMRDQIILN